MRVGLFAALFWALPTTAVLADEEIAGLLAIDPPGATNYLAARIDLAEGQALAGLQWYHNDGTVAFPELLLMEGVAGTPPDLFETALILEQLQGESLDWGSATLAAPVSSSTGVVYAVFRIPANVGLTDKGTGGGAGIGIRQGVPETTSYLSADGQSWTGLGEGYHMAVDAVFVQAKGTVPTLASLKAERTDSPLAGALVHETELFAPVPNPFNPRTTIAFHLAGASDVELVVYNVKGQRVRSLVVGERPAGRHEIVWQGLDDQGHLVSSGVYFVQLSTPAHQLVRGLALLR